MSNNEVTESVEDRKRRLTWQCRRGIKEVEVLLGPFFEKYFDNDAFVLGVNFCTTVSGVIHILSGSTSQKTGVAPRYREALAVAHHVKLGTITSSPGPTPSTKSAKKSEDVHELTVTISGAPIYSDNSLSKLSVSSPIPTQPERITLATASISASV